MYRYRIVGTQYGFSPLCVANLLFVLGLFADTAFAFGVNIMNYIEYFWYPFNLIHLVFNELLIY